MALQLIVRVAGLFLDKVALGSAMILGPQILLRFDILPQVFYDWAGGTRTWHDLFHLGVLLCWCMGWVLLRWWTKAHGGKKGSMYGLQHGRLHLQASTPMWMNMGYWNDRSTMAEACRDLLKMVLREAGFSHETERAEIANGTRRPKILIDLGFGCGDQTIYLMSDAPVRPCDAEWWDEREYCPNFDHYIGITKDATQHRYAQKHVHEMADKSGDNHSSPSISLFCEDAAALWRSPGNQAINQRLDHALEVGSQRWVLALDTAYHFAPSRWSLVQYAYTIEASFMAFDLCISPSATFKQRTVLSYLTPLMGAPFANFSTPDQYKRKLVEAGYQAHRIKVVDVSEHVFGPLARYLDDQNERLKTLGLGIGTFSVAKHMFRWWARSGVVRGVIVVAKR